jgi:lipopolysaccharide export system permease protein
LRAKRRSYQEQSQEKSVKRAPLTLYRYILSEILLPFTGALLFFVFVLLMFQIINLVDFFVVHKVSAYWVVQLLGFLSLSLLQAAIPIAFLLAVLLGIGRLSTDGELMAMRASGLSAAQLLKPVLACGFALFLVGSGINCFLTPWGTKMFRYELFRISNTKVMATLKEGTFMESFFDLMLYSDEIDPKSNLLNRVFIYDSRNENVPTTVVANHGQMLPNQLGTDGTPGVVLRLWDGKVYRSNPSSSVVETINFGSYDIFLSMPTAKVVGVEKPATMDLHELHHRIRVLQTTHRDNMEVEDFKEANRLKMELWSRFSMAFACVVFALLGMAFGTVRSRSTKSNSLLICLLVMLGYWQVRTFLMKYGELGVIHPYLAVETANILLLMLSAWVWRKNEA